MAAPEKNVVFIVVRCTQLGKGRKKKKGRRKKKGKKMYIT